MRESFWVNHPLDALITLATTVPLITRTGSASLLGGLVQGFEDSGSSLSPLMMCVVFLSFFAQRHRKSLRTQQVALSFAQVRLQPSDQALGVSTSPRVVFSLKSQD